MGNLVGRIMSALSISEILIEPISWKVKNITLGIHTQDSYDDTDPENIIEYHTVTIGFFFVRFTFEFVS